MCGMTDHECEWEFTEDLAVPHCRVNNCIMQRSEVVRRLNEYAALKRVRDAAQKYRENPTFKNKMDMYDFLDALADTQERGK